MKRKNKRLAIPILASVLALMLTVLGASACTELNVNDYSAESSSFSSVHGFDGEDDLIVISEPAPLSMYSDEAIEAPIYGAENNAESGKATNDTTTGESYPECTTQSNSSDGENAENESESGKAKSDTATDESDPECTTQGNSSDGENAESEGESGKAKSDTTTDKSYLESTTQGENTNVENAESDTDKTATEDKNEGKTNPFEEVYSTVISYSGDIFSALSFALGLVLALLYRKTLIPAISKVGGAIKGSVDTAARDGERLAKSADEKLISLGEKTEELRASLTQLEKRLDPNVLKADTDTIRRALALEADLVYSILMGSALPTYLKDELNDKMKTIKAVLGNAEK